MRGTVELSEVVMRKYKNKKSSSTHLTSSKNTPNNSTKRTKQPTIMLQCPTIEDRNAWYAYWQAQGQPWRTEPLISLERQEELRIYQATAVDIKNGIFSFKGVKLNRADVEWLVEEYGLLDANKLPGEREGLDLRGANLSSDTDRGVDLHGLPLARLHGGLSLSSMVIKGEQAPTIIEQIIAAVVRMERVNLSFAHLEGANLSFAHLEGADLTGTQLQGADLTGTQLQGATLIGAQLENANLSSAQLKGANLSSTQLKSADLTNADLTNAQLENVRFAEVKLSDKSGIGPQIADIQWGNTNLAVVDWSQVHMLGDEHAAYQPLREGRMKDEVTRLEDYLRAVRANRQLALALQAQGINEDASRYAYRAKVLQRQALLNKVLLQGTSKVTLFPPLLMLILLLVAILPTIILAFIETIEGRAAPEGFWTKLTIYPALLLVFGLLMPIVFVWPKVVASAARTHSRPFSSDLLTFFNLVVPLILVIILVLEEVPSSLLSLFPPQWWHFITLFQGWWLVWFITILLLLYQAALYRVPLLLQKLLLRLEAKHPQVLTIKGWMQGIRSQFSLLLQQFVDYGQYLLSLCLDLLAGYGYKPWRSLGWYIGTILMFALCYYALGAASGPHLTWHEALIVSLTSFHGRGFFAEQFKPGDPLATYAAAEAVVGLVIEASFIATFTQRFFGK